MKKVVVVIPVYNVEKYLGKCLEYLFNQTYKNFDIIMVNDGSTDNTEKLILESIPKFKKQGNEILYFKKENGGAASAINVALKHIKNYEYVLIMDGDDWIPVDDIRCRVDELDNDETLGAVHGWAEYIDEATGKVTYTHKNTGISDDVEKTFLNMMFIKDAIMGGYMFRTKWLLGVLANGQIYESNQGQNLQLLLPYAHKYRFKIMPQTSYYYLVRNNSHSHSVKADYESQIQRKESLLKLKEIILKEMGVWNEYEEMLVSEYNVFRKNWAFQSKNKTDFNHFYKLCKKQKLVNFKDFIKKIFLIVFGRK